MSLEIDPAYLIAVVEFLALALNIAVIGGVLLARRRDPSATLAWILFIVLAPFVGVLLYLVVGRTRMRRTVRRVGRAEAQLRDVQSRHDTHRRLLECGGRSLDARTEAQIQLGNALASTPASTGNIARVLNDAAATYDDMTEAIEQAQNHIHVEFYIIQPDAVGTALRDRLVRRAAAGIKVRVLCDAIGSSALPSGFWEPLRASGGKAARFAPLAKLIPRLRRRDRVDFRNHRKIVVVDGRIGFTGGINVGREYLGLDPNVGRWRDTHLRIEGPAVLSLQQAFLQDWLMATGETLDDEGYFTASPCQGDCLVQVIDSGPDRIWRSMELYHAQAITLARDRVFITNPYFVPSQTIESALTLAALRGVDVRLLLPRKSDSMLVTLASRSYYAWLLQAGVRIFEYERGFVHAKTMVVDKWVATIGSANMDMRSFNLNFELNAFVFDARLCQDIANQFVVDLEVATEVTIEAERHVSLVRRLTRAIARLLSPML
jgi:cardiolipin synthase A/B